MIADNFMWFPQSPDVAGETNDDWFQPKKAFEVLTFSFSLVQSDIVISAAKKMKANVAAEKKKLDRQSLSLDRDIERSNASLDRNDPKGRLEYQKKLVEFNKRSLELDSEGGDEEETARAKFQAFTVNKFIDFASPQMYKACSTGSRFPTAMLAVRKTGGEPLLYIQFMFRDVAVTSITWSGGGGEKAPDETVTFEFQAMGFQYVKQTPRGLGQGANDRVTRQWQWSTLLNKATLDIPDLPSAPDYLPVVRPLK